MQKSILLVSWLAASVLACPCSSSAASVFADTVVSYNPGLGAAPRYDLLAAAVGEPSHVNPFGEDTDPFNPPYGTNQILSVGAGGWLVLGFRTPILNHPHNLYGLDFTIFGNTGFIITNDFDLTTFDWIGEPATDGSLFGQSTGQTHVSVSRDGVNFYELDPVLTPPLDNFPPTDGGGNFQQPLTPGLVAADFAGATLADIRTLYAGSAGGASVDISWARDATGCSVFLPEIRYVRIDVVAGRAEIDGIAVVSRDPGPQTVRP
jgi:hypothetical protein